jgi:hypothetical protein
LRGRSLPLAGAQFAEHLGKALRALAPPKAGGGASHLDTHGAKA